MDISELIKRKNTLSVLLLLSTLSIFVFTVRLIIWKMFISTSLIVVIYLAEINCIKKYKYKNIHRNKKVVAAIIAIIVDIILSIIFYTQWMKSSAIGQLADTLHLHKSAIVITSTIALAISSFLFIYIASVMFELSLDGVDTNITYISHTSFKVILMCILSAVICITVCSQSSFLYPFNEWVDANCFFTVGKSMMNGIVPYRDLFEQKGPLLYFIHGIAWLISKDTFLGVYFIEIIAAFFFLYFSYKSFCILTNSSNIAVIPIMAAMTYISSSFKQGDSAEELCLCFLASSIWISLKALYKNEKISLKEYFLIGILSGCVFWIKFTLVGMYIGWFIMPSLQLIMEKEWKYLKNSILAIISGVIVSTVPYILYFGIHGAIDDWIKMYIFDNIFSYTSVGNSSGEINLIRNWFLGLENVFRLNIGIVILCLIGLLLFKSVSHRKIALHLLFMELSLSFFIFAGGQRHGYYQFVMFAFVPFAAAVLYKPFMLGICVEDIGRFKKSASIVISLCLCVTLCYNYTPNRRKIGADKNELPQYKFNVAIQEKENPTLLNYGFLDGGFYTVSNVLPTCKSFCYLNIASPEIMELQNYYVKNGLVDFVVVMNYPLMEEISGKYDVVYDIFYEQDYVMTRFMLYRLKSI